MLKERLRAEKNVTGGVLRTGALFAMSISVICAVPASAQVQDTTAILARYCGIGFQGELTEFTQNNPNLANLLVDQPKIVSPTQPSANKSKPSAKKSKNKPNSTITNAQSKATASMTKPSAKRSKNKPDTTIANAQPDATIVNAQPGGTTPNVKRSEINKVLFESVKAAQTSISLFSKDDAGGQGATFGLSHVLTYESVDPQEFLDPRDGVRKYNIAYNFGINTVLFDLNDRKIKALIPAIVAFNEVSPEMPTAAQQAVAFAAVFNDINNSDSVLGRWAISSNRISIRNDERNYFRIAPIAMSDEAKDTLNKSAVNPRQTTGRFIKNLSSEYEALLAVIFGKPIVPAQIKDDGTAAEGNQYLATIPDCLGQSVQMTLPDPAYEMRLSIEKLSSATQEHAMVSMPNLPSRGSFQTEVGYGLRIRSEVVPFVSVGEIAPVDSRTFRFAKSIRFAGSRNVNGYEQYFKLSSNFLKEMLTAYVKPDKKWIQENISVSITDKSKKDPSKWAKDWDALFSKKMAIITPAEAKNMRQGSKK